MADGEQFKVSIIVDTQEIAKKTAEARKKLIAFQKDATQQAEVKLRINIAKLQSALDIARKDLRKFKKEGDKDSEINARIKIKGLQENVTQAKKSLRDLQKATDGTKKSFFSLNGIVKDAVKAFGALYIIRSVTNALRGAIDASISFESAFAGVKKTIEATDEEFAVLSDNFRQLAKEIPVAVEQLAKIGELGGQLGVAKEDLIDFTETIAKIAVTTNLTEEQAATNFARLSNILQLPIADVENLASATVELGNNFATTESEIVEFATRIAPAGAALNLTGEELLGIGAAFTSVGIKSESGGTAVQKVLFKMNAAVSKGGKELDGFAATAGLTSEEFAKQFREKPVQALDNFVQGLGSAGTEGQTILAELTGGSERVTTAFLAAAAGGDLFTKAINTSNKASRENVALNDEASKRFETTESQLKLLGNRWNDIAITVGDFLKTVLVPVLSFFTNLVEALAGGQNALSGFANAFKAVIVAFAGFKVITGTVAAFTALNAAVVAGTGAMGLFAASLKAVKGSKVGGALSAIKGGIAALTNPIALATLAIGGLVFGILEVIRAKREWSASIDNVIANLQELQNVSTETEIAINEFTSALEGLQEQADRNFTAEFGADVGLIERAKAQKESNDEVKESFLSLSESLGATDEKLQDYVDTLGLFNDENITQEDVEEANAALFTQKQAISKVAQKAKESFDIISRTNKDLKASFKEATDGISKDLQKRKLDVEEVSKELTDILIAEAAKTGDIGKAFTTGLELGLTDTQVTESLNRAGIKVTSDLVAILINSAADSKDAGKQNAALFAAGFDEEERTVIIASGNIREAAITQLGIKSNLVSVSGARLGRAFMVPLINSIIAKFPALRSAVSKVANALGSIAKTGKLDLGLVKIDVSGITNKYASIQNSLKGLQQQAEDASDEVEGVGGGGGGGGTRKNPLEDAMKNAEKATADAEKALKDFEKQLEDVTSKADDLRGETSRFFQDIVDQVKEAESAIGDLNDELAAVGVQEAAGFARETGEKDVELQEELISLQEDLIEAKKQTVKDQDDRLRKDKDIKEIQAEILEIEEERVRIQEFLNGLTEDQRAEAQASFEEGREFATLSDFEKDKAEFEERLSQKEEEIQAEIDKQQRIIDIQKKFLELQASNEQATKDAVAKLIANADNSAVLSAEEKEATLEELFGKELTKEEELLLEKQLLKANALQVELDEVTAQQEDLLELKKEYQTLAEEFIIDSNEVIKASTDELIKKLEVAIAKQRELISLGGSPVGISPVSSSTKNINVVNNNSSNVDSEAALSQLINKV